MGRTLPDLNRFPGKPILKTQPLISRQIFFAKQHQDARTLVDTAFDIASFKHALKSDDAEIRAGLAADPATPPEILCFLTEDPVVKVRRAVAENPQTPNAANVALSRDADVTVRCLLAHKLVGEGLGDEERQNLWRMGFTILETLMRDKMVQVRRVLATGFRHAPDAPQEIVSGLAFDEMEEVGGRVLAESPLLTDSELIGYLRNGAPVWGQTAIASRPSVSPALGQALTETAEPPALVAFAGNDGAEIDAGSLDFLVERSETAPEIQEPLVQRAGLGGSLLVKLARIVAAPLLQILCGRKDIDADTAKRMNRAIESRKDGPEVRAVPTDNADRPDDRKVAARLPGNGERPRDRAERLFKAGTLTDDAIAMALDSSDRNFVIASLSLRAGIGENRVQRMVDVESARTVVALAWKAGLSARFAMDLQRQLAHIPHQKVINARNGLDFALGPTEMTEQLALFD
jgi:uncharacterized protein (DUF2336 family)